ncbi:MAG: hypothetical protein Q8Q17_03570 [bacterium]|nr:hypothetical protein [bacterium]
MQHIAFVVFAIVIITIAAYALFQYGLPPNLNLGSISQTGTSTAPTIAKKISPAPVYNAPAYKAPVNNVPSRTIAQSQIPSGFSIKDISPYFGKIRISASPGYSGSYSQIRISDNMQSSEGTVNITGWLMKGNRGNQYIPQAVSIYSPSGLTPQSDIYLKNGDVLTIYSTYGAIGVNLRLNKCIGYLANTNKFNPPLYQGCPYLNRSEIINFTGQCQNYILSLGSCQMPAANPPIPINDYSCAQFLSKLNYGGCFEKHRNDYDFLSNQWYAWSGSQFLDFQHDHLLLFDRQGLLVTEYAY